MARAAKGGAVQSDVLAVMGDAEKKIVELEGAVPSEKFEWRPAPGVRSIAEAYLHIAFANYNMTRIATGKAPPADAGSFWTAPSGIRKRRTRRRSRSSSRSRSPSPTKRSGAFRCRPRQEGRLLGPSHDRAGGAVHARWPRQRASRPVGGLRCMNKIVPPWSRVEVAQMARLRDGAGNARRHLVRVHGTFPCRPTRPSLRCRARGSQQGVVRRFPAP